ncbi:hypothetical protein SAMN02745220_03152 [Desulfopila aestuarii DSM 18488]|uniref:Uncharacterized protein n=1 Tax=Desulfopila aestuarii DSM 18488 TaxID=1121416 RepID=A0A1M7YBE1_9BACT|nr:hypothetical protein SAMN02745220_03152 [Desulfopila aestuarii DSM 18488]
MGQGFSEYPLASISREQSENLTRLFINNVEDLIGRLCKGSYILLIKNQVNSRPLINFPFIEVRADDVVTVLDDEKCLGVDLEN